MTLLTLIEDVVEAWERTDIPMARETVVPLEEAHNRLADNLPALRDALTRGLALTEALEGWRDAAVDAHVFAAMHPSGGFGGKHLVEFRDCANETCQYRRERLAALAPEADR